MNPVKIISGVNEDEIFNQVNRDLAGNDVLEYDVILEQGGHAVQLIVDIDLGGGFEGGFEITSLFSPLDAAGDFKFAIHNQGFLDEIGKFFGMQDVELGYPEFDKNVIVKTNEEHRVKDLFADAAQRSFFNSLEGDFNFGITQSQNEKRLEFTIEKGITNPAVLRTIYHIFYTLLTQLHAPEL